MEVTPDAPADGESKFAFSKYPGGVQNVLALPPELETKSLDVLLPFIVVKSKL
jgi:hypothetical protein